MSLVDKLKDHGALTDGKDSSRHWFFQNEDGTHLFVSDKDGGYSEDTATNHYYFDGTSWALHSTIEIHVIRDITQLDDKSFAILAYSTDNAELKLFISRNTDPNGAPGIQNYKFSPEISLDDTFLTQAGLILPHMRWYQVPGTFKITYSQLKDRSSVQMKHVVVELPTTPGETDINVAFRGELAEVHKNSGEVTNQVNYTLGDGSGVVAYSSFVDFDVREQIFVKIFDVNGNEITSEFKISNGDNVGDTITGIVPIEHDGREVLGFVHYAGNFKTGMPSGSLSLTVADTNGSVLKTFDLLSPSENPGAFGYTNPVLQKLEGGDYLLS